MRPIKFLPNLKTTIWGGDKIATFKSIDSDSNQIGESWEVSGIEGSESIICCGAYKGMNLRELTKIKGEELLGKRLHERFADEFPLLVKFIDAQQDLSIQVHPDDNLAKKLHNCYGKSEMWYIIDAKPGSKLYCGFKRELTPEEYDKAIKEGDILEYLQPYEVNPGDLFYIPAGRVHSIGAGVLVAEIQEPSNITYRVFDFNRRDKSGNLRELHIDMARQAIDFTVTNGEQQHPEAIENAPSEIISCSKFKCSLHLTTKPETLRPSKLESFIIITVLEGSATLSDDEEYSIDIAKGESLLIPASCKDVVVTPLDKIKYLASYI